MAGLTNYGKINTHNNERDGIHIEKNGKLDNYNEIESHHNRRHGVFVADDIEILKTNVDKASVLLNEVDIQPLQETVKPLLAKVKKELDAPEVSASSMLNTFSTISNYLSGVSQSMVATYAYTQLHNLITASLQLLSSIG